MEYVKSVSMDINAMFQTTLARLVKTSESVMKAIILSAVMICILRGAQSVYAEPAFQSGFKHGVADGKLDTTGDTIDRYYIHQPGKGFANHTTEFVDGYIHGWCLANHGGGIDANDDPEPTVASFDCDLGLSSAHPSPSDWPKP